MSIKLLLFKKKKKKQKDYVDIIYFQMITLMRNHIYIIREKNEIYTNTCDIIDDYKNSSQ